MWNERYNRVIQEFPFNGNGHLCDNTPYMQWYIGHTIRYITPRQPSSDDDVSLFFIYHILLFSH